MSNRIVATVAAAALAIYAGVAATSVALADEQPGAIYGAKTVGALYYETRDLGVSAPAAPLQPGAATAATVRWTAAPAETASVYGVGTVGALVRETKGLATSAADVARQGGAASASTVRWVAAPQG